MQFVKKGVRTEEAQENFGFFTERFTIFVRDAIIATTPTWEVGVGGLHAGPERAGMPQNIEKGKRSL